MSARIDREFLSADLEKLDSLIGQMTNADFLTRMGLESRRNELREARATIDTSGESLASVRLYFSGKPVVNNRGIESEFGANVIATFQDIVSKVSAARQRGILGQRGPVSGRERSKLHITHIVHGSFGFQFDELGEQLLLDSDLKQSVEQTTKLLASFDDPDVSIFGEAIEEIDSRILGDISRFFDIIQSNEAVFRIASGGVDKTYNHQSLDRAIERVKITTINEREEMLLGSLLGILPEQRAFEYRTEAGTVVRGKIDMPQPGEALAQLNRDWVQRDSIASFRIRDISRQGNVYRQAYFLLAINPPAGGTT